MSILLLKASKKVNTQLTACSDTSYFCSNKQSMFKNFLNSNQENNDQEISSEVEEVSINNNSNVYVSNEVLANEIYATKNQKIELPHDSDLSFAQNFIAKEGKFIYCSDKQDLKEKLNLFFAKNQLNTAFVWEEELVAYFKSGEFESQFKIERMIDHAKIAISGCESLVVDEGNLILNSNQNRFRPLDNFPTYQIVLASKNQLKLNIEHAVADFIKKHPDIFPFIIDLTKEEKTTRFTMNKPILCSRGTKQIIVFYCDECNFLNF